MKSLIAFISIFIIAVTIGYFMLLPDQRTLPIYQPGDINPRLVDPSLQMQQIDHRVGDFKLINQLGDTISQLDLEGQTYIADFFFTRCPTICPVMSTNLESVQESFKSNKDFKILSHSVTPEADSVSVLMDYAELHNANHKQWWFLTGPKTEIYRLARKSYFSVLDEGDGGMQDFIHTENFVLVDREKRLRGYYDGTKEKEVERLIEDVKILFDEYKSTAKN